MAHGKGYLPCPSGVQASGGAVHESQQMVTMPSAPHPYVVVHEHYRGDVSGGSSQPVVSEYVQCPPREYSAAPTAYESPIASAFRKRILLVAKPYQHDNAIEREEFRL